jgi:hypothetical protein
MGTIKVLFYNIELEVNTEYVIRCLQDGEDFIEIAHSVFNDTNLGDEKITLEVSEDEDFSSDDFRYFCLSDSICGPYTNVKNFKFEILKENTI